MLDDGSQLYDNNPLIKIVSTSLDDDVENVLVNFLIYLKLMASYPKMQSTSEFWVDIRTMF